jgi:hypothetical protein
MPEAEAQEITLIQDTLTQLDQVEQEGEVPEA